MSYFDRIVNLQISIDTRLQRRSGDITMMHSIVLFLLYLLLLTPSFSFAAKGMNDDLSDDSCIVDRVTTIIGQLTLDEKLSLLIHHNPAIPRVGLQAYSWWNEALHGVGRAGHATVYPMPVALAATFNTQLVEDIFDAVAVEARMKFHRAQDTGYYGDYAGLSFFTPNINIFRDPRWGRGMETYGEDPFLTAMMGKACVEGLQHNGVAACLKHFAAHSGPESLRHEFNARVTDYDLHTTYLPAFEYLVKNTHVAQVMCAYNRTDGVPCCINNRLLKDILRDEWNYQGMVVTDCWALNDVYDTDTLIPRHRYLNSAAETYVEAFGSEVDLECGSGYQGLSDAVRSGALRESDIDRHLRRVLSTRLRFESWNDSAIIRRYSQKRSDSLNLAAAGQSMVLLKNNGILPLQPGTSLRVMGPNANDTLMPLGNYNGTPHHFVSIASALSDISDTHSSVVLYVGGLNPQLEGEELQVESDGFFKGDRTRIELPQYQVDELCRLKSQGYHVILLLCSGGAIAFNNVMDCTDAIVEGWYDGEMMGEAVRQVLLGERDDMGRLPLTFYAYIGQLPAFDDYSMQRRTYRYMDEKPLFPFGFGLNYSHFTIDSVYVQQQSDKSIHVAALVTMDSTIAPWLERHRTVLQCYLSLPVITNSPKKSLVAFQTAIFSSAGESHWMHCTIDPFWLRYFDVDLNTMMPIPNGQQIQIQVGFDSEDTSHVITLYYIQNE